MRLVLLTVKVKQHKGLPFMDRGVVSKMASRFDLNNRGW